VSLIAGIDYSTPEGQAVVVLADAVNQLGMVVEEMARRVEWPGYTLSIDKTRRDWIERVRKERERVAELIPE
jgi:hypothetical protein